MIKIVYEVKILRKIMAYYYKINIIWSSASQFIRVYSLVDTRKSFYIIKN